MLIDLDRRFYSIIANMSSHGKTLLFSRFHAIFFTSIMSSRGNKYVVTRKRPVGGRKQICRSAEKIGPHTEFNMSFCGRQYSMITNLIAHLGKLSTAYVSKYKSFFTTTTEVLNMWLHGNGWSLTL